MRLTIREAPEGEDVQFTNEPDQVHLYIEWRFVQGSEDSALPEWENGSMHAEEGWGDEDNDCQLIRHYERTLHALGCNQGAANAFLNSPPGRAAIVTPRTNTGQQKMKGDEKNE